MCPALDDSRDSWFTKHGYSVNYNGRYGREYHSTRNGITKWWTPVSASYGVGLEGLIRGFLQDTIHNPSMALVACDRIGRHCDYDSDNTPKGNPITAVYMDGHSDVVCTGRMPWGNLPFYGDCDAEWMGWHPVEPNGLNLSYPAYAD